MNHSITQLQTTVSSPTLPFPINLPAGTHFHVTSRSSSLPQKWAFHGGQRRTMFIQTESTPNISSLMFYPGKPVMEVGSADFPNVCSALGSPLAKAVYSIDGVVRVFFGTDFVIVPKSDDVSWDILKPEIFAAVMDFYSSGQPLFLDLQAAAAKDNAIYKVAFRNFQPELVVYNARNGIFDRVPLGLLKISHDGITSKDEKVFRFSRERRDSCCDADCRLVHEVELQSHCGFHIESLTSRVIKTPHDSFST